MGSRKLLPGTAAEREYPRSINPSGSDTDRLTGLVCIISSGAVY